MNDQCTDTWFRVICKTRGYVLETLLLVGEKLLVTRGGKKASLDFLPS